jgi:hypothetical protein
VRVQNLGPHKQEKCLSIADYRVCSPIREEALFR